MSHADQCKEYDVQGYLTLVGSKIDLQLTGTIKNKQPSIEGVSSLPVYHAPLQDSLNQDNHTWKRGGDISSPIGNPNFIQISRQTSLGKNSQEDLVKILLKIPGITDPDPATRNRLYDLVDDPQKRRLLGQGQRYLNNPEKDIRSLVDKLKDIVVLDRWLIQVEELLEDPQLKQELHMIQAVLQDEEQRHDIQITPYNFSHQKMFDLMVRQFDLEELRTLCFKLKVYFDEIPGVSRSGKARDLIEFLDRRNRLDELVDLCMSERPKVDWDQVRISQFSHL